MKKTLPFLAAFLTLQGPAYAETAHQNFMQACPNLKACLRAVSELTGEKYVNWSDNLMCEFKATENLELTRENANLLFSGALNECGLSRVPFGGKNIFRIERINDAKGMPVPAFPCSYDEDPRIPETWDIVRMEYKMKHPEAVRHLENLVRTYANMGARIYGYDGDGTLVITESGIALRELYKFIRARDVQVTPDVLKKWEEEDRRAAEERLAEKRSKALRPDRSQSPPKPKGR